MFLLPRSDPMEMNLSQLLERYKAEIDERERKIAQTLRSADSALREALSLVAPDDRVEEPTNGHPILRLMVGVTTVSEAERQLIEETLKYTSNNKTKAAELLGISLKTLHNKLTEYGARTSHHDRTKI